MKKILFGGLIVFTGLFNQCQCEEDLTPRFGATLVVDNQTDCFVSAFVHHPEEQGGRVSYGAVDALSTREYSVSLGTNRSRHNMEIELHSQVDCPESLDTLMKVDFFADDTSTIVLE